MKPYELIIDEEACWGCRACEIACQQERDFASPPLLRVVEDGPRIEEGRFHYQFQVRICRHCQEPPCLPACPNQAIYQRPDSIVLLDHQKCDGCGLCQQACPYEAIIVDPARGKAMKCDLCHTRVDSGLYPACADNICMAHCIYFDRPEELRARISLKRAGRSTR
jgi:Fe-S-cluster-containing dehydrogenase component